MEVCITDTPTARQQLESELRRLKAQVSLDGLEVGLALAGGTLEGLDNGLALQFVLVQRGCHVCMLLYRTRQGYSVLHRQLRARPDGEVRRVRGISKQDDVARSLTLACYLVAPFMGCESGKVYPLGVIG
jgi:hypothetical protein